MQIRKLRQRERVAELEQIQFPDPQSHVRRPDPCHLPLQTSFWMGSLKQTRPPSMGSWVQSEAESAQPRAGGSICPSSNWGWNPPPRVHKCLPGLSVIMMIKAPISLISEMVFFFKAAGSRTFQGWPREPMQRSAEVSWTWGSNLEHRVLSPWDVELREEPKATMIPHIHLQTVSARSGNCLHLTRILKEHAMMRPWLQKSFLKRKENNCSVPLFWLFIFIRNKNCLQPTRCYEWREACLKPSLMSFPNKTLNLLLKRIVLILREISSMPNIRSWKQHMSVSYTIMYSQIWGPIKYASGPKPKHDVKCPFLT